MAHERNINGITFYAFVEIIIRRDIFGFLTNLENIDVWLTDDEHLWMTVLKSVGPTPLGMYY